MTPSPFPPFWTFFSLQNLGPKYTCLEYKKSAMKFLDQKCPPPPFQTFPKNIVGNTDVPQGVPKRLKLEFDPGEVGAVGMEILQNQNGPKV